MTFGRWRDLCYSVDNIVSVSDNCIGPSQFCCTWDSGLSVASFIHQINLPPQWWWLLWSLAEFLHRCLASLIALLGNACTLSNVPPSFFYVFIQAGGVLTRLVKEDIWRQS
ncbi:hypothetical protein AVEN_73824-1 [Araneus ventricosus]|uniref:Uncharacterized protein n=1 Tax=Araneus ventricosus TaxID=182803 RepID=A0A4Y2SEI0_ARAVE|nr:hypothetical protein AVEN_73824-1 [Araneus ventricosus]